MLAFGQTFWLLELMKNQILRSPFLQNESIHNRATLKGDEPSQLHSDLLTPLGIEDEHIRLYRQHGNMFNMMLLWLTFYCFKANKTLCLEIGTAYQYQ